jgi:hypothetical protein
LIDESTAVVFWLSEPNREEPAVLYGQSRFVLA